MLVYRINSQGWKETNGKLHQDFVKHTFNRTMSPIPRAWLTLSFTRDTHTAPQSISSSVSQKRMSWSTFPPWRLSGEGKGKSMVIGPTAHKLQFSLSREPLGITHHQVTDEKNLVIWRARERTHSLRCSHHSFGITEHCSFQHSVDCAVLSWLVILGQS